MIATTTRKRVGRVMVLQATKEPVVVDYNPMTASVL